MTGRTLGNYQILDPLGSGGMGEVYKARDTRLNRLVAIKILHKESVAGASREQRFLQEAKSASALNHPNIVTIYDIFQHEGVDCLVMEYVTGKTLHELIPRGGMPLKEALRIAGQVAEGLAKAHAAGLVHRDIKPGNVMVPESGPVKILDFGLAKLAASEKLTANDSTRTLGPLTEEGVAVGTVSYMSPEQAQGKPVDSRSDIFSFGSVLYEMLTGQRAFQESSTVGTLAAILHRDPVPLTSPAVPRALSRLISKSLHKNPEDRWQSMSDVRQLLEDVASDLESNPQSAPTGRRHGFRWVAIAGAFLAGALLVFAFVRTRSSPASGSAVLHQVTVALLQKNNIDPAKVTFVNVGSTADILKAVVAGTVDAGGLRIFAEDSDCMVMDGAPLLPRGDEIAKRQRRGNLQLPRCDRSGRVGDAQGGGNSYG